MSRISDTNGLRSSAQHKVRRILGNNTDSVHANGDSDNNQKIKHCQKKASIPCDSCNHFHCKEHLMKRNICTACNSTFDSE